MAAGKPLSPAALLAGSVGLLVVGAVAYRAFATPSTSVAATEGEDDSSLSQIAQLVGAYTAGAMSPEVMRQKIANYERMLATPGLHHVVPGDVWYQNEIAKMRARLSALETGQQQTATWRSLGQTATGVGIVTGLALAAYLGVRAIQEARE
ncbi:MAG: hypothetical protein EBZ50_06395 [Alphaproteobacteria bacterium]|nr:hypothetical protein [Alphaproteobacteria bacterium]